MQRLRHALVWLSRIRHCRGFGIQSPTDYQFVRYVVNEHWPYYRYAELDRRYRGFVERRLARLYLRLANWRRPAVVATDDYRDCFLAGCPKTSFASLPAPVELARVSAGEQERTEWMLCHADERSVLVVEGIAQHPDHWRQLTSDPRARITFDLYYCGIILFDKHRSPQHYIINF